VQILILEIPILVFLVETLKIFLGCNHSKKLSIVTLLVEAGTEISDSCLRRALELGTLDIVYYLLQKRPGLKTYQYYESLPAWQLKAAMLRW